MNTKHGAKQFGTYIHKIKTRSLSSQKLPFERPKLCEVQQVKNLYNVWDL